MATKKNEHVPFLRETFETGSLEPFVHHGIRQMLGLNSTGMRASPEGRELLQQLLLLSKNEHLHLSPGAALVQETFGAKSSFGALPTFQRLVRSTCVVMTLLERIGTKQSTPSESPEPVFTSKERVVGASA